MGKVWLIDLILNIRYFKVASWLRYCMRLIDYEGIHERFILWRKKILPITEKNLCIGSKGFESGINVEISKENRPDIVGSVSFLPIKNKSFENVLIFEVLEHLENPVQSLHELKRVSKKAIYASVPAIRRSHLIMGSPGDKDGVHKFELSPKDFKKMLSWVGLRVRWRKRFHSFFFSPIFPLDLVGGMFRAFDLYLIEITEEELIKMKILISSRSFGKSSKRPLETLKKRGFEVAINPFGRKMTEKELIERVPEVVGIVAGTEKISEAVISSGPKLKVISRAGIGIDNIDLKAVKKKGILVFNTPDAPTLAVAELALGLMLNLLRRISECDRKIRDGKWKSMMGELLTGKTLGIIGLGRIGKTLVSLTKPFKLKIIANDPIHDIEFARDNNLEFVDKETLISKSDIITLHAPLTDENHHMIGEKELSLMKKSGILINTSRGGIVDEEALFRALSEGWISGAALDTFENEPYEGPLTTLDNIVLTSHVGSYAKEARINMETETVENLLKGLKEKGVL
ncbi:MAG: NAD(P)-dependent oxidoreductase [Candidatus Hodarchaeales archaeon]